MIIDPAALLQGALAAMVATAPPTTWPDRRFVWVGDLAFDCVDVAALVSTRRGPVAAGAIEVGDEVWAWLDGRLVLRPVTATVAKGSQDIFRVRTGHRSVRVTANHRSLILRPKPKARRAPAGRRLDWVPEWVATEDLRPGDALVVQKSLPEVDGPAAWLPDGTELTPEVAWLLGVFVGDGHVTSSGVNVCVFGDLRRQVARVFEDVWGLPSTEHPTHGLMTFSRSLRDAWEDLGMRVPGPKKSVPAMLWRMSRKHQRAFLDGYAAADAHRHSLGYVNYATASAGLAGEVRAMHMALGDTVSNLTTEERTRPITIKGRAVGDALPLHRFSVYPDSPRRGQVLLDHRGAREGLADEHFTVERIRSIEPAGVTEVCDLTVADAHNFIADGVVVHNCEEFIAHGVSINQGLPGSFDAGPVGAGTAWSIQFGLTVVRCVPVEEGGEMPSDADATALGLMALEDGGALVRYALAAYHAGTLVPRGCSKVLIGPVNWGGPLGGLVGTTLLVTAQL